jgi:hypothetical protein
VSCDGKHYDCVEQSDCLECRVQLTPVEAIDAERVAVRLKPYTDDKRTDTEMLEERFQELLCHIDNRVAFLDEHPPIRKCA